MKFHIRPLFTASLCIIVLSIAWSLQAHAASVTDAEIRAIEHECVRLVNNYAYYRDHGKAQAYADLFAEDGELHLGTGLLKGRTAIAKAMEARLSEQTTRHIISTIHISVQDTNHAKGVSYLALYASPGTSENGMPQAVEGPMLIGEYHDNFVKTDEGWRIADRNLKVIFASKEAIAAQAKAQQANTP